VSLFRIRQKLKAGMEREAITMNTKDKL